MASCLSTEPTNEEVSCARNVLFTGPAGFEKDTVGVDLAVYESEQQRRGFSAEHVSLQPRRVAR